MRANSQDATLAFINSLVVNHHEWQTRKLQWLVEPDILNTLATW